MTDIINFYWSLDITKEDANNIIEMEKETTTENNKLNDVIKVELEERLKECEKIRNEIASLNFNQIKGLSVIVNTGVNISSNIGETLKTLEKEKKEEEIEEEKKKEEEREEEKIDVRGLYKRLDDEKREKDETEKKAANKKKLEADPMKRAYLGTTYEDKKSKIDYNRSRDTTESTDDIFQLSEEPLTEEKIESILSDELNVQKEGEEVSSVSNPSNPRGSASDSDSDGEPDDNNSFLTGIISDSITDSLESLVVEESVEKEKEESQSPEEQDNIKEKISEAMHIEEKKLYTEATQLYNDICILQKKHKQLEEVSKFDYYLNYDINFGGFSFMLDLNTNPQTDEVQTGQQKYKKVFLFKKGRVSTQYYIVSKEKFTYNGKTATPLISFSSFEQTILEYKDIVQNPQLKSQELTGSTKILKTIISEFTKNNQDLQSKISQMAAAKFASLTKEEKKTFNALLSRVVMQNYASIVKSPIAVKILSKYIYEFYSAFIVEPESEREKGSFHEENPLLSQSDDNNNKNKSVFEGMAELEIYLIQCIFGHLIINVLFTRGYNKNPFKGKLLNEFKTIRVQAQEAATQLANSAGNTIKKTADGAVSVINSSIDSIKGFPGSVRGWFSRGGSHKINRTLKKNGHVKKIFTRRRRRRIIKKINYVGGMNIFGAFKFSYDKGGPFKMWVFLLTGLPFTQTIDNFGNRYFFGIRRGKTGGKLYDKVWSTNPVTILGPFIYRLQKIMTKQMNSTASVMYFPFIFFEMIALILLYIIQMTDVLQAVTFFTDIPPESIFIFPFILYVICRAVRIPFVVLYGIGDILSLHGGGAGPFLRSLSKFMHVIFIEPITQREEHFNDVRTIMQGGSRIKKTNYVSTILDEDEDEQTNMELFPKNSSHNKNKIHKEKTKTRRKV